MELEIKEEQQSKPSPNEALGTNGLRISKQTNKANGRSQMLQFKYPNHGLFGPLWVSIPKCFEGKLVRYFIFIRYFEFTISNKF